MLTRLKTYTDAFKDAPKWVRWTLLFIIALVYSLGLEPLIKQSFDIYATERASRREMQEKIDSLELKFMEKEYQDSVMRIAESVYIDLALIKGFESYVLLNSILENTDTERASLLVVTGTGDSISWNQPAFGTFLYEISRAGLAPLGNDWDGAYIPVGMKRFLVSATKDANPILSLDVSQDTLLQGPETSFYLRKKDIKSMLVCFIGKSPINYRHYFLLAFYHSDPIDPQNVARDIYYARNAAIGIRRLFALQMLKEQ